MHAYLSACCLVQYSGHLLSMDTWNSLQDVAMVHSSPYQAGGSGLGYNLAVFAVADGHNGSAAALHCQEALYRELMQHMPTKPPPIAPGTDGVY